MTDHDCNLKFAHTDCERIFSQRDKRELGWIFKTSDGMWNYVNTDRAENPLPAGNMKSRQAALNWLRLGDREPTPPEYDPDYPYEPDGPPDTDHLEPPPNWEP